MPIGGGVCLTATLDILRAIARGAGPSQAVLALGYAGWASGQLESEILANGWLVSPADPGLIFDADFAPSTIARWRCSASTPHGCRPTPATPDASRRPLPSGRGLGVRAYDERTPPSGRHFEESRAVSEFGERRRVGAGDEHLPPTRSQRLEQRRAAARIEMGRDLVEQRERRERPTCRATSRAWASTSPTSSAFCSPVEAQRRRRPLGPCRRRGR